MHEYYQKSSGKLKKTMRGFLSLVRLELERITKQPYETAFEEIWRIYEHDMLGRFPYIGGDKASGTKNLTQAYMLVAMGEYLKRFGCSPEEIGRLMTLAYERRMQKTPPIAKALMGKLFRNPGLLNKMFRKKDAQNAANAKVNPGSFETKTQVPPEPGFDFSYHNLVCPLSNFAKQYGYEAYMPYLCNLDYVMFGMLGAPLFRSRTCFEDDFCDFKLKLGAKPLSYWPPVFSQDNGCK